MYYIEAYKSFPIAKASKVVGILEDAHKKGLSIRKGLSMVRKAGFSYYKKGMRDDWQIVGYWAKARTPEARLRAEKYLTEVVLPFAERRKIPYSKAIRMPSQTKRKMRKFELLTEEERALIEAYEEKRHIF